MSYARLEGSAASSGPAPTRTHPGELFLHAACGRGSREAGRLAPFSVVSTTPPVERPDEEYPFMLTTGRRLESYNTGVQTGGYDSPLHRGETLDISPEDAERLGMAGRRPGAGHVAPRNGRRAGAHRPVAASRASSS